MLKYYYIRYVARPALFTLAFVPFFAGKALAAGTDAIRRGAVWLDDKVDGTIDALDRKLRNQGLALYHEQLAALDRFDSTQADRFDVIDKKINEFRSTLIALDDKERERLTAAITKVQGVI